MEEGEKGGRDEGQEERVGVDESGQRKTRQHRRCFLLLSLLCLSFFSSYISHGYMRGDDFWRIVAFWKSSTMFRWEMGSFAFLPIAR